jgi:hypothetical protein
MSNFGVHYQAYKNRTAVEFVLQSFRKYHPDDPFVLWSDAGDDFSDICNKYNATYFYSDFWVGYNHFSKEQLYVLFDRMRKTCEIAKRKYLLLLEDDILVRGKIEVDNSIDFCGLNSNHKWPPRVTEYLHQKYDITLGSWGCGGGSTMLMTPFIENFDKFERFINEDYEHLAKMWKEWNPDIWGGIGYQDILIHIFFTLCGKKYSISPLVTCSVIDPNWEHSSHPIVHSYKNHYINYVRGTPYYTFGNYT